MVIYVAWIYSIFEYKIGVLKYITKIWPLIILMMIAPGKNVIGDPVSSTSDDHDLNIPALSNFRSGASVGTFTLNENTTLSIKKNTTLLIKNNIRLHSPITGQGVLVLSGDNKLSLDANGNSISRLMIKNTQGVELLSQLSITNQLSVEAGYLYLNDFNIKLSHSFVKLNTEGSGDIAFNGTGRIIGQTLQPLANNGPQNDRDYNTQAFNTIIANQNPYLSGTQIVYYKTQNCESAVLCPPTPPPD